MELNNVEQVQMEYKEMDIWKVNEFNFLNEEIYMYIYIYIYIYTKYIHICIMLLIHNKLIW